MHRRWLGLAQELESHALEALLVTGGENRYYLTGFDGSAGVAVMTKASAHLIVDSRYAEQAKQQAVDCEIIAAGQDLKTALPEVIDQLDVKRLGFESQHMTVAEHARWQKTVGQLDWVPVENVVENLRMIKDPDELAVMHRAAQLADAAFREVLPTIRSGRTEADIALDLEFCMRRRQADGVSFPLIIASGLRSALPHGRASDKRLKAGEFVTVDFGARYQHYCSDATRTLILGTPDRRQQDVYDTVLRAQEAALKVLGPGITGREADQAARTVIDDAGFGRYFGHGLGHGLGLAVHEAPRLSPTHGETVLQPGMVVSVEPGIYIPGWGGVRIEDVIVITETGYDCLTGLNKELVVNHDDFE